NKLLFNHCSDLCCSLCLCSGTEALHRPFGLDSAALTEAVRWSSKENLLGAAESDPNLFVALYDFVASGDNTLSITKGEKLRVLGYNQNGEWSEVRSKNGQGWVPSNYITPVNSLEKHSWYHGPVSRSAAEYLLSSLINGSFLVRESESSPGQLSISLRYEGRVYHYRINTASDGKVYVTSESRFSTLAELVHHHSTVADGLVTTLHYPAPKCNKPTVYGVSPIHDKWEMERTDITMKHKLGGGQYGEVYVGVWKKYNLTVAVKTLKEDTMEVEEFLKEAAVMKEVKHPNLVQLLGVCTLEPPFYIVTEYMLHGNLLDYLRDCEREEVNAVVLLYMATQISSAMEYLEKKNFIHSPLDRPSFAETHQAFETMFHDSSISEGTAAFPTLLSVLLCIISGIPHSFGLAASLLAGDCRSSGSPALPRKQRDKSPSSLLEDPLDASLTRDRKAGFFSSFMKKKSMSSSSSSSSSQPQHNLPVRSNSFRDMETGPHKKYEPASSFGGPQTDSLSFSPSHGEGNHVQSRCCGATFGQKPSGSNSSGGGSSQVGSSSSWAGLAGFFTPRLLKKTLGIRPGKPSAADDSGAGGSKPFPRSNSTSSMSAGLPDLERMALTLPRNRSKPTLERTASTASQPENGTAIGSARPSDALLKKLDEGTAQIRDRPKAKLLPRGASGGVRAPGVGGEADSDDRLGWPSPSKTTSSTGSTGGPHNHKVPVLISPTLKHSPADVHLVGVDSQGNRFKLLADGSSDRDRPRLVKPKCAPPPPPTLLRSLQHAYSADGAEEAGSGLEVNGDAVKRSGRGMGGARPCIPPPQVPPVLSASTGSGSTTTSTKMANGASGGSIPTSSSSKLTLRRTRQQTERVPLEKISKEALLECAEGLSNALHSSAEPSTSSQVLDAGHQLLDYCSGYVDCIPQTRNKFAFREAVGKLELSLQELRASSTAGGGGASGGGGGGGGVGGAGTSPALDNLHSCIKEISDVVQR
uniref:Tyrosine-protein kinase n=1 Tax=Astyanax mexicanus TaxID=7994 RepID=A0A8B9HB27_ASTMX